MIQANEPGDARIKEISQMFVNASKLNYEEKLEKFAVNRSHYAQPESDIYKTDAKTNQILGGAIGTQLQYSDRQKRNLYEMFSKARRNTHEPIPRLPILRYLDQQKKLDFSRAFVDKFISTQPKREAEEWQVEKSPNEEEKDIRSPLVYRPTKRS